MKKIIIFFLIISLMPSCFIQPVYAVNTEFSQASAISDDFEAEPSYSDETSVTFDDNFLPAGEKWLKLVGNDQPAVFNAEYELADNVAILNQTVSDNIDKITSELESGSLLNEIYEKKGGTYDVILDTAAGSSIPDDYFACLKDNLNTTLSFKQTGADITFQGKDILTVDVMAMYNIGFTYAAHETDMLDVVGSSYENFTYGFQHHGELPGIADFAIDTGFTEGTTVNVYRFDSDNARFIMIAGDIAVGKNSIVNYKNNMMFEYLITTKSIADAEKSDMVDLQNPDKQNLLLSAAGVSVLLLSFTSA